MYRYFNSAIFLRLWSSHAYFNYFFSSTWLDREINRSRDFHQIKLCIENINRQLILSWLQEVHSSGINSVELSAYSSNMLRYISDLWLLNYLYTCLPIYKAWHLVWGCGYCVQSRKCHVRYNSRSLKETRDVRCLVSPSRAFCSSHSDSLQHE